MQGSQQAKVDNDLAAYKRAVDYLASLASTMAHRIVQYRADRGLTYGVIVNEGDRISLWDAFRRKVVHYPSEDFNARLISYEKETT